MCRFDARISTPMLDRLPTREGPSDTNDRAVRRSSMPRNHSDRRSLRRMSPPGTRGAAAHSACAGLGQLCLADPCRQRSAADSAHRSDRAPAMRNRASVNGAARVEARRRKMPDRVGCPTAPDANDRARAADQSASSTNRHRSRRMRRILDRSMSSFTRAVD